MFQKLFQGAISVFSGNPKYKIGSYDVQVEEKLSEGILALILTVLQAVTRSYTV